MSRLAVALVAAAALSIASAWLAIGGGALSHAMQAVSGWSAATGSTAYSGFIRAQARAIVANGVSGGRADCSSAALPLSPI